MVLFHRKNDDPFRNVPPDIPGLADAMAAQGWAPISGQPFDGHLEDDVHETARTLYGFSRGQPAIRVVVLRVGGTTYRDAFRGTVDGRAVTVASVWTAMEGENRYGTGEVKGVAVCAVELPTLLPIACVQPRQLPPIMAVRDSPTGNAAFDERYSVVAALDADASVLTPELQRLITAHDDWVFRGERYLLGCVSKGRHADVQAVWDRIDEVLRIVAAIPASVMPDHVDHIGDDLIARLSRLTTLDEGLAFLEGLTSAERDRVATSDSPLAALADVRTPQEAMARFKTLGHEQQQQLMAQFTRVSDATKKS